MVPLASSTDETARLSLLQRVVLTFPGTVILDSNLTVVTISPDVLELLNLKAADVIARPIATFSPDPDFEQTLRKKILSGFFNDYETVMLRRGDENYDVRIAGFDASDPACRTNLVALRIMCARRSDVEGRLGDVTRQLECFLNSAWHELRGPIATIRGIMNLVNHRKDNQEVDLFFDLIRVHIDKLDVQLQELLHRVHIVNTAPFDSEKQT